MHAPTSDYTRLISLLRPNEVATRLGISATTLWRLSHDPTFPTKYVISPNAVGYDESEIAAWLAQRRPVVE